LPRWCESQAQAYGDADEKNHGGWAMLAQAAMRSPRGQALPEWAKASGIVPNSRSNTRKSNVIRHLINYPHSQGDARCPFFGGGLYYDGHVTPSLRPTGALVRYHCWCRFAGARGQKTGSRPSGFVGRAGGVPSVRNWLLRKRPGKLSRQVTLPCDHAPERNPRSTPDAR
jgi:hypothetical protein